MEQKFQPYYLLLVVSQYALMHYIQKIDNVQVKQGKKKQGKSLQK